MAYGFKDDKSKVEFSGWEFVDELTVNNNLSVDSAKDYLLVLCYPYTYQSVERNYIANTIELPKSFLQSLTSVYTGIQDFLTMQNETAYFQYGISKNYIYFDGFGAESPIVALGDGRIRIYSRTISG